MWRLRQAHQNGNLYLGLGAASAAGAGWFAFLSARDEKRRRELETDFDNMLAAERIKGAGGDGAEGRCHEGHACTVDGGVHDCSP